MHFNPDGNQLWAQARIEAFADPSYRVLSPAVYSTKRDLVKK
jgi:hypothetical protein